MGRSYPIPDLRWTPRRNTDVVDNPFVPVPLPLTFWLTASGLPGLWPLRARRNRIREIER